MSASAEELVLSFPSIAELAKALDRRVLSSVELTEFTLDRLDRQGRAHNAIATVLRSRALEEAARADRRGRAGGSSSALLGIPYGAKDLLAARGGPTTWGAAPYRDRVLDLDATAVTRLRRRGGVLCAKLATIQLAGAGGSRSAAASLQGPCRNPWDPQHFAGGSSSGPAVAVAAGLLPYALATESSGSIASPAAFCGITGVRPTYGLVSRHGVMPASWTLDKVGVIARSAADCSLVLAAVSGYDPLDGTSCRRRFRPLSAREARSRLAQVRLGLAEEDLEVVAPQARAAIGAAIDEFRRLIPRVARATLPPFPYPAMISTVFRAEAVSAHEALVEGPQLAEINDPKQRAALRAGLEIRARDYLQAMRLRTVLGQRLSELFERVDVLLSYTRPSTAPALDQPVDALGAVMSETPGNSDLIAAGNLAGLPGVFVPCGLATDGLPVGLQLVGPPFSEPLLLALASAYQRVSGHHLLRPRSIGRISL